MSPRRMFDNNLSNIYPRDNWQIVWVLFARPSTSGGRDKNISVSNKVNERQSLGEEHVDQITHSFVHPRIGIWNDTWPRGLIWSIIINTSTSPSLLLLVSFSNSFIIANELVSINVHSSFLSILIPNRSIKFYKHSAEVLMEFNWKCA